MVRVKDWVMGILVLLLALPQTHDVTLGKLLHLFVPPIPYLENGTNTSQYQVDNA